METVLQKAFSHHDALRFRYKPGTAEPRQFYTTDVPVPVLQVFDLTALNSGSLQREVEKISGRLQATLDLGNGPVAQFAFFHTGRNRGLLSIILHHLVVDGVSWRILIGDIFSAYLQALRGEKISFPAKTTSYRYWAKQLADNADMLRENAEYWFAMPHFPPVQLPLDFPDGRNSEASGENVIFRLSPEETDVMLKTVAEKYNTKIDEILLAALSRAFLRWSGENTLFLHREGHGREPLFDDVDLSRTVGWFTSLYPAAINISGLYKTEEIILSVKEQLRRIPANGIAFGLLKYLSKDRQLKDRLSAIPTPSISFNYLGRFGQGFPENFPAALSDYSTARERSPDAIRPHILDVSGSVINQQLKIQLTFSTNLHKAETIRHLSGLFSEEIRNIISHAAEAESVHYSPSDFQEANLSQQELQDLMSEIGDDFENE